MKKVFQNSMVAHVWAQQTQDEGRSNNGQFYFNGPTIYSYGHHFPIATFIDDGKRVIINDTHYSSTTSKHQNYVRCALPGSIEKIYMDTHAIKDFIWDRTFNDSVQRHIIRKAERDFSHELVKAKQKKAAKYKAANIRSAKNVIDTALNLFNTFRVVQPQSLIDLRNSIATDDIAAILKADDDRIEAERIAAEKEAKLKEKKIRNFMEKWWIKNELPPENQGYTVFSPYSSSKIYMRINGENIETSRGATFPITHAIKAFKLLRVLKEKGVTYTSLGNKTIHLGHFKIDNVDKDGNVTAGCHYVEWDQIERCAVELEIYP